jgi:hypothetical protein
MTFIEQIQFIIKDIRSEMTRIYQRIKNNRFFGLAGFVIVVGFAGFLIYKFSEDAASLIGPLIGMATAIILNFFYSLFKDNSSAKEKITELGQKSSNLEDWKSQEADELIRKSVESLFIKRIQ